MLAMLKVMRRYRHTCETVAAHTEPRRSIPSFSGRGAEVVGNPSSYGQGAEVAAQNGPKRPKTAQSGPGKSRTQIACPAVPAQILARFAAARPRSQIQNGPKWPKMAPKSKNSPFWAMEERLAPALSDNQFVVDYWPETHTRLIMAPSSERSVDYVPGTQSL